MILVGRTEDGVDLHLLDQDRTTHVQIIGSTGRGKTQSVILPWAIRDVARGKSTIIIDGKGSPDLKDKIFESAKECGQGHELLALDLNDFNKSCVINPLKGGSAQQITDRLFSSLTFEEPYYKFVQQDICGTLVKVLKANSKEVTLKRLYELLTDENKLSEEVRQIKGDMILLKSVKNFLKEPKKERDRKVFGLISQLSPFATGELSDLMNGEVIESDKDFVNLTEKIIKGTKPFVLVISIPSLKYQESGHILGKLVLQSISYAVGERENNSYNDFLSIFLDEFSEFVYPKFISVLNKARSANVSFHLSHQSMGDLDQVSESFAKSVMTNTNVKCILGVNDPVTADYFSRHFGTNTEEKTTEQVDGTQWGEFNKTGKLSLREVESFKIAPNLLKELYHGRGVLHLPTARRPCDRGFAV